MWVAVRAHEIFQTILDYFVLTEFYHSYFTHQLNNLLHFLLWVSAFSFKADYNLNQHFCYSSNLPAVNGSSLNLLWALLKTVIVPFYLSHFSKNNHSTIWFFFPLHFKLFIRSIRYSSIFCLYFSILPWILYSFFRQSQIAFLISERF